ncbi:MAG: GNAT family N-acetyltransferase [Bryobacteraceae bacterium]
MGSRDFHPIEQNLRQSFRVLASHRETGDVREAGGVTIASLGVAFQMFNAAFLDGPVETEADLKGRIATAAVHFSARGLEWSYWVCESWLERKVRRRATNIFNRNGLDFVSEMPGMAADRLAPPVRSLPEFEAKRVCDERTRLAFCDVGAVCFNVPLPWFREVFDANYGRRSQFVPWVAYHRGEPVATAATVAANGVVGIYNVATVPQRRRQGFGEGLMRFALDRAREESGIERTILQSTAGGLRLYERMGYTAATKVLVYTS